jgi:hypothetical protein
MCARDNEVLHLKLPIRIKEKYSFQHLINFFKSLCHFFMVQHELEMVA